MKGILISTIFVDLQATFHHMLWQFIFNTSNCMVHDRLSMEINVSFKTSTLHVTPIHVICQMGCANFYSGTRFCLDQNSNVTTETFRWTRSGSPTADIGYKLLMSRILHRLDCAILLMTYPNTFKVQGQSAIGTRVQPIAWVDDSAIPLASVNPNALEALTAKVAAAVYTVFADHGMSLNVCAGKTAASKRKQMRGLKI